MAMRSEGSPQVLPDNARKVTISELKLFENTVVVVLIVAFCWAELAGVVASIGLMADSQPILGTLLLLVVIVVAVCATRGFKWYRGQRTVAYLRAEAEEASRNAAYYFAKVKKASASIGEYVENLTRQLESADAALKAHRVGTFWDDLDDSYRALAAISAIFNSLKEDAARYRACLEGRNHTFPKVDPPLSLGKLDAVVMRYQNVVAQADERQDLIEIFEQRREKHGPAFRELKGVGIKTLQARDAYSPSSH